MATLKQYRADLAMIWIVLVWGFHFVIVKDAIQQVSPLVFQAIRFSIGTPIFLLMVRRLRWSRMRLSQRDFIHLLVIGVIGLIGYQICFIWGLQLTTATNSSLLISTMPTWTAFFSILVGKIVPRSLLFAWIGVTIVGVVLVILGRGGSSLRLSRADLDGSLLSLLAAFVYAGYSVLSKPLVDRYGAMVLAIWTHWLTALGLVIIAAPQLIKTDFSAFPTTIYPQILYSGIMAGVGGYMIWNFAVQEIGPAKAAVYNNFTPLVSAFGGVVFLQEPLTALILVGAMLIIIGVMMVRQNMQVTDRGRSMVIKLQGLGKGF
jgi:drug/metabolite transporter (DMT)-like permease